jgi:hypothetical protein
MPIVYIMDGNLPEKSKNEDLQTLGLHDRSRECFGSIDNKGKKRQSS